MEDSIWLLLSIALLWFLAYFRASLITATLSFTAFLIVASIIDSVSIFSWLLFIAVITPLLIDKVRKSLISAPILNLFKGIMPEMSSTERDAINAGTTWFEAELFRGSPDWQKLHDTPQPHLTAEEQAFLDGPVNKVCKMTDDWQSTHVLADLSEEVWQFLKDEKFFAMIIKKSYGGLEFSAYAQSRILQKLSGVSTVLSSTVGVPNSLGPGELLQHYGTQEQKDYYLPRLACGKEIPCFALTSPEAGSDAGAIPDVGIVCHGEFEGKNVLGMKLTWNKRYITLAPVATVLGLAFKLQDPDNLLPDDTELGITCALIPTDLDGVIIGRRHFPLNVPFQNGPTQGNDVFVPLDFIIGGVAMAGQGWRMLVECLSVGRAITLPSNSTGAIKSIALATGAYCRIRHQFKMSIGKMEGIEEALARIGGNAYLMDAVTSLSTSAIDLGEKPSVISAICKYHLTEKMRSCTIDAMDIHGGKGICLGPNNYLGRTYQGAPVAITVEGANILTRSMIIYGQGAIRCHPYVLAELTAASQENEDKAINEFDHALFGHIGFALSNSLRSLWIAITSSKLVAAPFSDFTKGYYQTMTRFSANLAILSDIAMLVCGGDLKRRERLSARLGDVLSYLYLASATLKKFNDEGRNNDDKHLVVWSVEDSLFKAQTAINELLNNFPNKYISIALRLFIFPYGLPLKRPTDITDHEVAKLLQTPSDARSRLGSGQYLTNEPENPFGQIEQALIDVIHCEPIFKKICMTLGEKLAFCNLDQIADRALSLNIITFEEAQQLKVVELARKQVINVDDFNHQSLTATDPSKK